MFGVNELIRCFRLNTSLTEDQKKRILNSSLKDKTVIDYLKDKLSNLTIKINNEDEYPVFELMEKNKLLCTCFQTSETIAALLDDDDYVERGIITRGGIIDKQHGYNHSWVCFFYEGIEYVLDASLNILCTKENYYKSFNPECYAKVEAKAIKEELIRQLTSPREIDDKMYDENGLSYDIGIWENGATCAIIKRKDEVDVNGSDDKQFPLYANFSSYIADIENKNIKKLVFHHYKNPCSK